MILIFLVGCSGSRQLTKNKDNETIQSDINQTIKRVTTETQQGGSVTSDIKPESERDKLPDGSFKEYEEIKKDGAVTQKTVYLSDGSARVNCDVKGLERRIEELTNLIDKTNTDKKTVDIKLDEEFKVSDTVILSIMGGLVIITIVAMFIVTKTFNNKFQQIIALIPKK